MERYKVKRKIRWSYIVAVLIILALASVRVFAEELPEIERRMQIYKDYEYASGMPWYELAAIDQYERNIATFRKGIEKDLTYDTISIRIEPDKFSGSLATISYESDPIRIGLFAGIGRDGDGDGIVDIHNEADVLQTIVDFYRTFSSFEEGLTVYYQNPEATRIILSIAKLFESFDTIDLGKRHFPVSTWYAYSYQNGYGAARGWGGRRAHEGIDVFAGYGTPVVATSYGIVEVMGWNEYGGYRVGIRDIYNTYQYYAHLQGFADGLQVGNIVSPGDVIGSVGATGYGPEGTSGKFAPHLHFGLYKFDGRREWAFNPYPHMIRWERQS